MIELPKSTVNRAMVTLAPGLEKYLSIQAMLPNVDVSTDRTFQRLYNGFYKVRRNSEWQSDFYSLFSEVLQHGGSFEYAFQELKTRTGRWEPSFASKLVASVDTTQPVIDSVVLKNLGLKLPTGAIKDPNDRLESICLVYKNLKAQLHSILTAPSGNYICDCFKRLYPDANIEPIKMLDLVLWQIRD